MKTRFTKAQEKTNAVSHGIALIIAITATVMIIRAGIENDNIWHITSASIFGATLILLYFSSTLNHSLNQGKAKDFFHNFDQLAIYLLIAGSYTPVALAVIKDEGGWLMFGLEWGFALAGLFVKIIIPNRFERGVNKFVIISYVIMGWLLLFFLPALFKNLSTISLVLIFAGGLSYSIGIVFYKLERLKYSHLIWHLFVIGGSTCHWIAFYLFFNS